MSYKKISGYTIFLKQILGKGSFGCVYVGEQENTEKKVAIKVLEKKLIDSDDYLKEALFSEIQILQAVKSENITKVYDVMESANNYYIIQELCDSDLQKFLQKQSVIDEKRAIDMLKQICNGFLTLVREGIVHRDIKPANILLSKGIIKIADFGFAKKNATKRMKNQSSVGTPLYMSVQVLKSLPYTSKCDIWGVSFIFYEMLHGKTPWTANTAYELVNNIEKKPLNIANYLKPTTADFLRKSLAIKEQNRLSWDQVFLHPIFDGYFHQFAIDNKNFENKLKMLMGQLRFKINSENIDLNKLLAIMNLSHDHELSPKQFGLFMKNINPDLSKDEISFCFQKIDIDDSGTISVNQLEKEMIKYDIKFQRGQGSRLKKLNTMNSEGCEKHSELSKNLEQKAKKCFEKLYRVLKFKHLTLYKTFVAYDQDRTNMLSLAEFQKMIHRLDNSFTEEDIVSIFRYIDADGSNTIEFKELNEFYCKANGIPQALDLPQDYFAKK